MFIDRKLVADIIYVFFAKYYTVALSKNVSHTNMTSMDTLNNLPWIFLGVLFPLYIYFMNNESFSSSESSEQNIFNILSSTTSNKCTIKTNMEIAPHWLRLLNTNIARIAFSTISVSLLFAGLCFSMYDDVKSLVLFFIGVASMLFTIKWFFSDIQYVNKVILTSADFIAYSKFLGYIFVILPDLWSTGVYFIFLGEFTLKIKCKLEKQVQENFMKIQSKSSRFERWETEILKILNARKFANALNFSESCLRENNLTENEELVNETKVCAGVEGIHCVTTDACDEAVTPSSPVVPVAPSSPSIPVFDVEVAPSSPSVPVFDVEVAPSSPSVPVFDVEVAPSSPSVPVFDVEVAPSSPSVPAFDVEVAPAVFPAFDVEVAPSSPAFPSDEVEVAPNFPAKEVDRVSCTRNIPVEDLGADGISSSAVILGQRVTSMVQCSLAIRDDFKCCETMPCEETEVQCSRSVSCVKDAVNKIDSRFIYALV